MKWPKRRGNQATHVFTHALNKQENKGAGCRELCAVFRTRVGCHAGLPHQAAPIQGPQSQEGRWEEGEKLGCQDALSKLSLELPLGLPAGSESPDPERRPAWKMAISDIPASSDETLGSTKAGDSPGPLAPTHCLTERPEL